MHRHFWKWTFLLGVASPAFGQDQQNAPAAGYVHPQIKEALRKIRKSYRTLSQALGEPAGVANPGIDRQIKSVGEMEEAWAEACARIQVDPRAERAAAAMRRSSYKRALRMLALMLTAKPDDPYASYLAGMCAAELGRFEEGAQYFAGVLNSEPTSHTSRLLSAYCKNAAKQEAPLSDEAVLACFEAGLTEAAKHAAKPETEDDGDAAAIFAKMFGVPDVVKDPLLYVLDNEAANGRGPRAFETDRFVAAAQKSDDTYELFLACLSTANDDIAAKIEERLDGPQHAVTMKALLFLMEYYGKDNFYRQRGPAFENDLAELQKLMPDEGLWLMFGVEYQEPDAETYEHPPLTKKEFVLFEHAVSASRLTIYHSVVSNAAMRLFQRLRFPWARQAAERLGRVVGLQYSVLREVVRRAEALAKKRFDSGDMEGGLRVARAIDRFGDQLEPNAGEFNIIVQMLRPSYRRSAAELVIQNLPSSHTEVWLAHQRLRLDAWTTMTRQKEIGLSLVASVMPVTAINDADNRLLDGQWPEWKLRRVSRMAHSDDGIESNKRRLTWALDGDSSIRTENLLEPGILKVRELLPLLRRFREIELDDNNLWPLVWTRGELEDKESIDWLIGQLSDQREWLKVTAAEALQKITGLDHGLDPAAWKDALDKQP